MKNNQIREEIIRYVNNSCGPIANEWIVINFARMFKVSRHQISGNLSWISKSGECWVHDGRTDTLPFR